MAGTDRPIIADCAAIANRPDFPHPLANGSTIRTPAFSKPERLRVTIVKSWVNAVAAIRLGVDQHRLAGLAQRRKRLRPAKAALFLLPEAMDALNTFIEPPLEPRSTCARWQEQNAETDPD